MNAIEVSNLTKIYRLYNKPKDRLKELMSLKGKKYHHEFYALKDVSFNVEKGQTIGIIGQNGSGKSTLLKTICGVLQPTQGNVTVNGRVSSLLELGAGFHPEFTGRENVYMNGALMGYNREEMDRRIPEIIGFADIGEFIDQPVKTYSSGMFVRLAFAAAINVDPEILVVDEALSVGDMFFQSKCMTKMKQMIDRGLTLLFVSHDLGAVKRLCQKCVLLSHGRMLDFDVAETVVDKYFAMKVEREQHVLKGHRNYRESSKLQEGALYRDQQLQIFYNNAEFQKRASFQRIQNGKASIVNVQLLNEKGEETITVDYEQQVILRMAIEVHEDAPMLAFSYHIRDKNGADVIYSDSFIENSNIDSPKKGDKFIVNWRFKASLMQGYYNIVCVLSIPVDMSIGHVDFCDYVPLASQFTMAPRSGSTLYGSVHWDNQVEIRKVGS